MFNKKIIAVIDTETAGTFERPFIYDFAYQITNKNGDILEEKNYLIDEIITNPRYMMGAFYAKKIFSKYIPMLDTNEITLKPWNSVRIEFLKDCAEHGVNVLSAYNFLFDVTAIRSTHGLLQHGKFLNFGADCLDIWRFACQIAFNTSTYKIAALKNNWISKAGNFRTTAEHAYKFLMCEPNFIEDHTALSDVNIERQILTRLFDRKKKIPYNEIQRNNWMIPNSENLRGKKL